MKKIFILLVLFSSASLFAQVKDLQLGMRSLGNNQRQGGLYDYSDPNSINMEVSIWGFVRYPGKYIIPLNSSAMDFLSLAGGPTEAANLDDIRIYREVYDTIGTRIDTSHIFLNFDYKDLLWNNNLENSGKNVPKLKAGDNLSVPGEPKIYDKDWISIGFSIVSILISITTLIVTLSK